MVKKFNEYISEGLWSKGVNRAKTGELRKESGKKIMTKLGVEIVLQNQGYDYEKFMKNVLDSHPDDTIGMDLLYIGYFKMEEQRHLLKDELPYSRMIDKSVIATFATLDDLMDDGEVEEGEMSEEDYLSMIHGISSALKNTELQKLNRDAKRDCNHDYALLLMDEGQVYLYECELDEHTLETYFEDFREYFEETFEDTELIFNSFSNYACDICVEVNYNNLLNYQKMKEFVKSYYDGLKDMYNDEEE